MTNLKLKPLQWKWRNNEWVARTIVGHYSVYYVGAWSVYLNTKHIFTAPHHVLDGSKDSAEATLCKQKCEEDLLNKIKEHLMECEVPSE